MDKDNNDGWKITVVNKWNGEATYVTEWKSGNPGEDLKNILQGIYGMLICHTYLPTQILKVMKEFAEENLPYEDNKDQD